MNKAMPPANLLPKTVPHDPLVNPLCGDIVATRGYHVLIEDSDPINLSYRYRRQGYSAWSRIYLTTITEYRKWPIDEVVKRGAEVAA